MIRLFAGTSKQFLQDTIQNQIAEKLKLAFFNYFRFYPSPNEINSWRNSYILDIILENGALIIK